MKIAVISGARPNFMKIAPLLRAIHDFNSRKSDNSRLITTLIHTGQHYDYSMSEVFFQDLGLPKPDIHLGIGSGTHGEQTGKILIAIEQVFLNDKPDLVIVVGDVNSTLAAALAAAKLHIPVAHIEAGIRSNDRDMPEEINRLVTDHLSRYLFTTSKYDDDNLKKEGISPKNIFRVGNIMVDSLLLSLKKAEESNTLSGLNLTKKQFALLTLHRPGNVDEKESLTAIMTSVSEIAQRIPVIFPAHPRTQKNIDNFGLSTFFQSGRIRLVGPQGYFDFINLEMNSKFVITDSGGIQVETTVLKVPCLTILNSPVWLITQLKGTNTLVGTDSKKLINEANKILDGKGKTGGCPELWDGKTAARILETLIKNGTGN